MSSQEITSQENDLNIHASFIFEEVAAHLI
jgi:hypothetical protein